MRRLRGRRARGRRGALRRGPRDRVPGRRRQRRGAGAVAHRRRARALGIARRARQQRGDPGREDDRGHRARGLGPVDERQPARRLRLLAARDPGDARERRRLDRQHRLGQRFLGRARAGGLLRGQGWGDHADPGDRCRERQGRDPLQLHLPRLRRHRDGRPLPRLAGRSRAARDEVALQHAVGRVGQPVDIAACVQYLASDAAGFVTGAAFVVDGGLSLESSPVRDPTFPPTPDGGE